MTQNDRNEAETRAELIDPVLAKIGWGKVAGSRIRREMIAPGRLIGAGKRSKKDIADFVLTYRDRKLAVIEAKRVSAPDTEGLGQAKKYARNLQARFAYSTNGIGIYQVDMETGEEGYVDTYPTPQEMWNIVFRNSKAQESYWRERFAQVPFEDKGGQWELRYYQHNAITNVLDALAQGKDRILLTLATGTGKTAIAFQIIWKLFYARWNGKDWRNGLSSEEPNRRPRVLFLADRNILANQAFNSFSAFPEDALVRIDPDEIKKKARVPKNGNIFFTIFQTFMTGKDKNDQPKPNFGEYPPDFFDFIVIDECHRGGANDESTWRDIMTHFSSAVQLGLTATPKRKHNRDTYAYFGNPVYVYSLKEGINDGFLTPFKVRQISTTLDDYVYTSDDHVTQGEIEEGKRYTEAEFNRRIEIREREKKRVEIFMNDINQSQKTLVFCAIQEHALLIRDFIIQIKAGKNIDYCVRVTADDGELGEQFLRTFQDNEKTIPTILTTSRKLSTGVDARNVRNIVLLRPVNSMIEFKQIIGRGTRLFDGKDYFVIYDFVKAYHHFSDPEWDGDPLDPEPPRDKPDASDPDDEGDIDPEPDDGSKSPREKIIVKLADGKERTIDSMMSTSFWSPDGKPISAVEFLKRLFGELPAFFKDEAELRKLWSQPDTRRKLLDGLAEKGYDENRLSDLSKVVDAEKSDLFDVLAYVAFSHPPISREERVHERKNIIFFHYQDDIQQEFLSFVLNHYENQGVGELDQEKLPQLLELKYHTIADAVSVFGSTSNIREMFVGFQKYLYEKGVA